MSANITTTTAAAPTTAAVSFVEAVRQRYGAADASDSEALLVNGGFTRPQDKKWQFVGAEKTRAKQSRHDRLALVVLRNCGVATAMFSRAVASPSRDGNAASPTATTAAVVADDDDDDDTELKEANMVSLQELDLSENAGLTLKEAGKLLPYLPRLSTLQLCDIRHLLTPTAEETKDRRGAATGHHIAATPQAPLLTSAKLTKLVLNNTGFRSLGELRALIEVPALTELHLDANQLTSLDVWPSSTDNDAHGAAATAPASFPHVTTLSLAHNALHDWDQLGRAIRAVFPALTQLFLTDNRMDDVELSGELIAHAASHLPRTPAEEQALEPLAYLKPLTLLCLKDNATLTNPATVDAVRVVCPHLRTFRISYATLLPTWNETNSRMYVVAALPTITLLNRGAVRPKERLDAELLYVQRGLQQRERLAEEDSTAAATVIPYPLVDELREKHKDVVLSVQREGDTASTTDATYLMLHVTLQFVNGYAAAGATSASASPQARQTQKLPSSLTVAKLKALVHKMFQVKPVNQRLSFRSGDHGVLETATPLQNEQETLGYYGVPDGAILYVEDASLRA